MGLLTSFTASWRHGVGVGLSLSLNLHESWALGLVGWPDDGLGFTICFSRNIGRATSFTVELWGLRDGLTLCKDLNLRLISQIPQVRLGHCYREANGCADFLAKKGITQDGDFFFLC